MRTHPVPVGGGGGMRLGLLDIGSTAARLEIVDLDRSRMPRADWSVKARTRL